MVHRWFALVALTLTLAWCADARGAAGDLDPTFSGDGRVALAGAESFVARAVAIDSAGRILVAGYSCKPDAASRDATCLADGDASFRLARLTPDGGLDPEFGLNGLVRTPVGDSRSQALEIVMLPGDGFVVGGVATSAGRDVFALVRYTADGNVDDTFAAGGYALQPIGTSYALLSDLAAGPNGTLIAAGQAVDAAGAPRMAVARFSANGVLDPAYGTGGATLGGAAPYGYGLSVAAWPDGGTITVGASGDTAAPENFRVGELRLDAAGRSVMAFGMGGAAEQRIGAGASFANAVLPLPGDAWLAAGAATVEQQPVMAVVRGTASGDLDPAFGLDGAAMIPFHAGAIANDLVAVGDGRVVAVGQANLEGGAYVFAQARLLPDGRLDPTFGAAGRGGIGFERYPIARATAAAMQPDGKLVSAGIGCDGGGTGTRCTGGSAVLLVIRQLGDPRGQEPTPTPTPAPDTTAPRVRLELPARISRRALRRKGIKLTVRTDEVCRVQVVLTGRPPGKRRARRLDVWRARDPRAVHSTRLKGRARRGAVRIAVRVTDAARNARSRTFTVRVR